MAAEAAEEDDCHEEQVVESGRGSFYPLAVETFGYWTSSSLSVLKTIASRMMTANLIPFSQAFSSLMEQLSLRLWQLNRRMIACRLHFRYDFDLWDLLTVRDVLRRSRMYGGSAARFRRCDLQTRRRETREVVMWRGFL